MAEPLTARAVVPTDAAARYAKQLVSHLGRGAEVREEPAGTRLVFDHGACQLRPGPDALTLIATAPSRSHLDTVMQVVGSHLEHFGRRHKLTVTWDR